MACKRSWGVERRILPDGGTLGRWRGTRRVVAAGAGAARARGGGGGARCSHLEKLAAAGKDLLGFLGPRNGGECGGEDSGDEEEEEFKWGRAKAVALSSNERRASRGADDGCLSLLGPRLAHAEVVRLEL
jgi:hypothetical protein